MAELIFPDRPIGDPEALGISAVQSGALTLVAKGDCQALVAAVLAGEFDFKGFEAFTLFDNGSVQPHLRYSCDWPEAIEPTVEEVMEIIDESPDRVTHYEFYFRPSVKSE
ncbi:MAG: hypothetical protein AAF351_07250 [Pseudomonadota bacterium]